VGPRRDAVRSLETAGNGCFVPWSPLQRAAVPSGYGLEWCDNGTDDGTAGSPAGIDAQTHEGEGYGGLCGGTGLAESLENQRGEILETLQVTACLADYLKDNSKVAGSTSQG